MKNWIMVALTEKKNYNNCIIESILRNSWGCKNTRFAPTAFDLWLHLIDLINNKAHKWASKWIWLNLIQPVIQLIIFDWIHLRDLLISYVFYVTLYTACTIYYIIGFLHPEQRPICSFKTIWMRHHLNSIKT